VAEALIEPLFGPHLGAYSSFCLDMLYGVDAGLMVRRLTNNPFLGVRFSRRAEEPKQDITKISQQIALTSGLEVVWMLRLYRYLSISLPCAMVANTTAQA
jgi:hypothetical protein